jgi:hypothetical protein
MSQQSSAIVAQSSSSAKKPLKRSMTPRSREMAAKKAKGIERKLPAMVMGHG